MKKYVLALLAVCMILFAVTPQSAFATPALPVDRDTFSIGDTVTAEITAYGVKSAHTGYKEDNKNAKIFYTREGRADPAQPLRFILASKQSLPGTIQEMEITAQPFDAVNRYAGKKMEKFYRKAKGSAGKRLNVNVEYKIPPKARLLVVTAQLKDYYKKGNLTLPRYTTVEYELRVVGYAEANANPLSGKTVKKVNDSKGKRIIIEDKHSDAITAAIGIGGSLLAAFIYWLLHRVKKKGSSSAQQTEQRKQDIIQPQQEIQHKRALQEQEAKQPVSAAGDTGAASSAPTPALDRTSVSEQPRLCSNCGAKLKQDSRFCENCGAKV